MIDVFMLFSHAIDIKGLLNLQNVLHKRVVSFLTFKCPSVIQQTSLDSGVIVEAL